MEKTAKNANIKMRSKILHHKFRIIYFLYTILYGFRSLQINTEYKTQITSFDTSISC